MDYYSIFDMEDGTIGFAPHTASSKHMLETATLPESTLSSDSSVLFAEGISWVIILVIAGGAFGGFYWGLFPYLHD